jgi:hypothetical protein
MDGHDRFHRDSAGRACSRKLSTACGAGDGFPSDSRPGKSPVSGGPSSEPAT